jgi:hypothetical protein
VVACHILAEEKEHGLLQPSEAVHMGIGDEIIMTVRLHG